LRPVRSEVRQRGIEVVGDPHRAFRRARRARARCARGHADEPDQRLVVTRDDDLLSRNGALNEIRKLRLRLSDVDLLHFFLTRLAQRSWSS
jgi:hypothetical protein